MKCQKCGSDNREGIRFCEECGAKIELECPDCKAKIPLGKKFCGECGYDLSKSPKPAPATAHGHESQISESPSKKTTPTPIPDEGERKHVTVLFSDLSGYTKMSETEIGTLRYYFMMIYMQLNALSSWNNLVMAMTLPSIFARIVRNCAQRGEDLAWAGLS